MSGTRKLFALAWRESRTARRRLLLYMSSISLGVAALVAIDSFSENVTRSVHEQSRALTGGDLAVSRNSPFPERTTQLLDSLDGNGVGVARSTAFASMALATQSGNTRLVQVRAITPDFPFYGEILTRPRESWSRLHGTREVVVDPALLVSLDAAIGDTLALGTGRFIISGTLERVPGDIGLQSAIGPRVYISETFLPETGLLVFGSRAQYEAVLQLPADLPPRRFTARFGQRLRSDSVRVRTADGNEDRLADAIEQLSDFLAIVGLVALLLGGIGVATGVHAFVLRKIDAVAILRCLGATSGQVLLIYVMQATVMGLIGALIGVALGVGLQLLLPGVLEDFLPLDVEVTIEPVAIALGLAVGVWVATVFALRPLVALRRVSPLQALRRDTDADVIRRTRWDSATMVVSFAIVASVAALGMLRAETVPLGLAYSGGIATAIGVLWLAAAFVSWLARRLIRPGLPFTVRQGLSALYRPGNQTRTVVLALGFGVFLMGTLYQVQRNLLRGMNLRLEEARANVAFFDVQEDQVAGLDSIIRGSGTELLERTPIVRMRISSINGVPTRTLLLRRNRSGWALRREYNSTYKDSLSDAEEVVSGKWFSPESRGADPLPEISVEAEVARELGLSLGDTVAWNVQGVDIPSRVTSFREVRWASFQPNFFVIFSPGALDAAPKQFVFLAHADSSTAIARLQRDVVRRFPTISSLDLTLVQQTIGDVVGKVTMAIRFLAFLSLGLSIPVLFSAVAATRRQRLREGVLLKVLGATRSQIGRIMLAEYAMLGALGALTGMMLSTAGAWALTRFVFETNYIPLPLPLLGVGAAMMALSMTIGMLTGRDVFRETPMAALREA